MAELGYEVLGLDVDKAKIDQLSEGRIPFFEPGLDELLARPRREPAGCASPPPTRRPGAFGDVHFLCVGTPQKKGEFAADMTYVDAATNAPAPAPAARRARSSASPPSRPAPRAGSRR